MTWRSVSMMIAAKRRESSSYLPNDSCGLFNPATTVVSFMAPTLREPGRMHAMNLNRFAAIAVSVALFACSSMPASTSSETARHQVWAAELAFARTMADRDLSRFSEYLAEEAVFFAGTTALRGKSEVVEGWSQYFTGPDAPFSWEPDQVEVLASGGLALSTGPVLDPAGNVIARFNSIWRLEPSGEWRVVFDKGSPPSPGPQ